LLQKDALYYDTSKVVLLRERSIKILKSSMKFVAVTTRQYFVKCETDSDDVSEQIAGGILGLGGTKYQRDKGNYKVGSFTVCTLHQTSFICNKYEFNMICRSGDVNQNTYKIL
jgi:hypothetical protein